MSTDEFSLPATGAEATPGSGEQGSQPPPHGDGHTLRRQVMEVIEHVMADTEPGQEWARIQLGELLAAHPENPERALLEHLIATRRRTDPAEDETPSSSQATGSRPPAPPHIGPQPVPTERRRKKRIEAVLGNRMLLTAFQPIRELPGGRVTGVEALTRFVSKDGASAETWFREAAAIGLGTDLEIAALQCALSAAQEIPKNLFVAFNLSPATLTQFRLPNLLEHSRLAANRIVIELIGPAGADDWEEAARTLNPLRNCGLRVAVDGSGSDAATHARIRSLRPEIIKLDRTFITQITAAPGTTNPSVVRLALEVGAVLAAEGVETEAELAAVVQAGLTAGQGYLLGRPSVHPLDWSAWIVQAEAAIAPSFPAGPGPAQC